MPGAQSSLFEGGSSVFFVFANADRGRGAAFIRAVSAPEMMWLAASMWPRVFRPASRKLFSLAFLPYAGCPILVF